VRVYQFRHIRAVEPIVAGLAARLAPRPVVAIFDDRKVLEIALDATREVVAISALDHCQTAFAATSTPPPQLDIPARPARDPRPFRADNEDRRAGGQDNRNDAHMPDCSPGAKCPRRPGR
jgi:hypothetical protein